MIGCQTADGIGQVGYILLNSVDVVGYVKDQRILRGASGFLAGGRVHNGTVTGDFSYGELAVGEAFRIGTALSLVGSSLVEEAGDVEAIPASGGQAGGRIVAINSTDERRAVYSREK